MDKRSEPRFATDQNIILTTLGENGLRQTARIKNAAGGGLGLIVQTEIAAGTAVRIEWNDAMLLGEVMYKRAVEEGCFVGVQLEQVLFGLSELHREAQRFHEEATKIP